MTAKLIKQELRYRPSLQLDQPKEILHCQNLSCHRSSGAHPYLLMHRLSDSEQHGNHIRFVTKLLHPKRFIRHSGLIRITRLVNSKVKDLLKVHTHRRPVLHPFCNVLFLQDLLCPAHETWCAMLCNVVSKSWDVWPGGWKIWEPDVGDNSRKAFCDQSWNMFTVDSAIICYQNMKMRISHLAMVCSNGTNILFYLNDGLPVQVKFWFKRRVSSPIPVFEVTWTEVERLPSQEKIQARVNMQYESICMNTTV